jgi:hypothetical protein
MARRRKFKAIAWPHTDQVSNRRNSWWVVEVSSIDGSYYPHKGPVSKKYAHEEADRMQKEWDEAEVASAARLEGE